MTPEQAFGQVLHDLRRERGLSQERLGFESGYHPVYISQLERGLKSPSLGALYRLAQCLAVTAGELVCRIDGYSPLVSPRAADKPDAS